MKNGRRYIKVKKSHLREDIREAKGMIRELQRGVRRDEKELGMKRRNKRLGSPPEEHFMQATNLADMASEALRRANQHLSKRDCGAAMAQLKNAALNVGAGLADLHGSGEGWGTKQVKSLLLTEKKRLNTMTERFKGACLKSPKEVKAGARAKRRNR